MRFTSEAMARSSARHPWRVVGVWVLLIVISMGLSATLLGDALTANFEFTDNPESERAETLLAENLRGETTMTELVLVRSEDLTATDEEFRRYIAGLQAELSALGGEVIGAGSFLTFNGLVSEDGNTAMLPVTVRGDDFGVMGDVSGQIQELIEETPPPAGFEVFIAGQGTLNEDFNHLAEEGLQRGEAIGIAIALIILVVVLGTIVAAIVPILMAIAGIIIAFGVTALIGQALELSFFITNFIAMIGLAVGIDYSLFIVSRYREERMRGYDLQGAIERAGGTSSRAVFFSGLIVILALSAMLLVPASIFVSLGLGAIIVVIIAIAAALTLLPATIALLGDNLERLRVRKANTDPEREGSIWDRIGASVMRHPWISLTLSVGFLLILASFYFRIDTGFAGVTTLPEDTPSAQAFAVLTEDFGDALPNPVEIVVDGEITPEVEEDIAALQAALAEDGLFGDARVTTNDDGSLALVSAPLLVDSQAKEAADAIVRLRTEVVPAAFEGSEVDVLVGGQTAFNADFIEDADQAQPIIVLWVLALSFVLLMLVFRSVVIPVTSVLMNLLSVGAAYGLIVLVFQRGAGPEFIGDLASIVGFQQIATIESWIPLMLFSILFGLSMDYQIFLLSRIKERWDHTHDNEGSVRHGLRSTASIITAAALIMVAVFGGFAAAELVPLQQMGFGLAVAVLIDATIVRSVLVPATMKILGEWNWYFPSWLGWLPVLRVEGEAVAASVPSETEAEPAAS